jgi:hypothetical protein
MNKAIFIIPMLVLGIGCTKNNDNAITETVCTQGQFYYYNGAKYFLDTNLTANKLVIGFPIGMAKSEVLSFINDNGPFVHMTDTAAINTTADFRTVMATCGSNKSCVEMADLIKNLNKKQQVSFASYVYKGGLSTGNDTLKHYTSIADEFIVQVKDGADLSGLTSAIAQTNTSIRKQLAPDTYLLKTTKDSKGNAMQMANFFFETGQFKYAEPNLYYFSER